MTVRLSPHKASKILVGYFRGLPQTKIAKETGVDQSSVSHYATRFKEIAAKYGLVAAGKGYRLMDEVESLRSLSVELYKSKLTVEEARRGHDIIKAFLELGISPKEHLDLIQLCKKIDDPDFPEAAIKLSKIEAHTGNNYQQLMSGFEDVIHQLPQLEKKISEKEAELKSINEGISQKKKELAAQEKHIAKYKSEVKSKESQMEKDLSEKMKQMGITSREVEEVAALKAELTKKKLTIDTVIKVAEEFKYA